MLIWPLIGKLVKYYMSITLNPLHFVSWNPNIYELSFLAIISLKLNVIHIPFSIMLYSTENIKH